MLRLFSKNSFQKIFFRKAIANGIRSSESIKFQFWQFEHMLKLVNKQEELTGRLSSIRHVIDMTGYGTLEFFIFNIGSSGKKIRISKNSDRLSSLLEIFPMSYY